MSPKSLLYPLFLSSSLFLFPLTAQSIEQDIEKVESTLTQVPETKEEKEKRIAKAIVDAVDRTKKNMATKGVDPMFKRAQELHKQHAQYLEKFNKGEVRQFSDVVANWPSYQAKVLELNDLLDQYNREQDLSKKQELLPELLNQIQPIGKWLKSANHKGYVPPAFNAAKLKEEDELMVAYNNAPTSEEDGKLELTTPDSFFTLRHLPMPILFSAPEGTEIFLFSELGGNFANSLDYIKITANDKGVASTWWVSHGDGVGRCQITYKSPEYPSVGFIVPHVKTLELMELEAISPTVKKVANKAALQIQK